MRGSRFLDWYTYGLGAALVLAVVGGTVHGWLT